MYLYLRSLFQMEPRAKKIFGFSNSMDLSSPKAGLARQGMLIHSKRMIGMLDAAFGMLGPEHELLTEVLSQLGERHARYGVKKEFFPVLGHALMDALAQTLGDRWTYDTEEAWEIVFGEMSSDIIKSMP